MPTAAAAADGCPSTGAPVLVLLATVAVFLLLWWIAWRAWQAPARADHTLRCTGKILQVLAAASFAGSVMASFGYAERDSCDRLTGIAGDLALWLTVAAVILFSVGVIMTTASEWAAIFAVAVLDFGVAALSATTPGPHRRLIITLLAVHGTCTSVAGWWSWRVHLGSPLTRAKGSEAGRTLVAGWIILAVLQAGLSGEHGATRSAADTQFLALFVVTAIGLVMGTGYTRYAEARQGLGPNQQPGFPRTRRWRRASAGRTLRHRTKA